MIETNQQYIEEVKRLCRENNIQGLEQMVDSLVEASANKARDVSGSLLSVLCVEIARSTVSSDSDERKRLLVRRLASVALQETDSSDLFSRLGILDKCLRVDAANRGSITNDWPSMRRLSAQQWLTTWSDLEHEIDDKWALDAPENSIRPYIPPGNIPFVSGMSPEGIKDPDIRTEYEAHLEKNCAISERNRRQQELRKLKTKYEPVIEAYIVRLYSERPPDQKELHELLTNVADEALRKRIQDAVLE